MSLITIAPVVEIPQRGREHVYGQLEQWNPCGPGSYRDFLRAIKLAGSYIAVAFQDGKYDDEQSYLGARRALSLDMDGDPRKAPEDYFKLTGDSTWETHNPGLPPARQDVMLVDFMAFFEGAGVSDIFIPDAKKSYAGFRSLSTYSPTPAVRIHKKRGARPVHVLLEGRPGYKIPVVVINNYWAPVELEEVPEGHVIELLKQLQVA